MNLSRFIDAQAPVYADALAEFDQERAATIRSSGIKKLTMGAFLDGAQPHPRRMNHTPSKPLEFDGFEIIGIWEQIHNPDFKGIEFETFRNQAGLKAQLPALLDELNATLAA